jgi:hypothetical protein
MVKQSMSMLWSTALSVFDVGSSIVYYLLGRDLDESDILLIQQISTQMTSTREVVRHTGDDQIASKLEEIATFKLIELIEKLKRGKDLLLVTSKSNGYNILQTGIANLLVHSANLLQHGQARDR